MAGENAGARQAGTPAITLRAARSEDGTDQMRSACMTSSPPSLPAQWFTHTTAKHWAKQLPLMHEPHSKQVFMVTPIYLLTYYEFHQKLAYLAVAYHLL